MNILNLPAEIILIIFNYLDISDFKKFRLAHRKLFEFSILLIPHYSLAILNIYKEFQDFLEFLLKYSKLAENVKRIIIYDRESPSYTIKAEWKNNTLLIPKNLEDKELDSIYVNETFTEYTSLYREECNRKSCNDTKNIFQALSLLPSLFSVTISDIQFCHPSCYLKYSTLQKRIWIVPYLQDYNIAPTIQRFFLAFHNKFANITNLSIIGSLDPSEIEFNRFEFSFPSIQKLDIK